MLSKYNSAKKVADFYVSKMLDNLDDSRCIFGLQAAQMKELKRQNQSCLDAITSYDLEYETT